jgi:small-conductance mechanosensitive channel
MLYSPPDKTMSSFLSEFPLLSISNLLHIVGIIAVALLFNRLLRISTQSLVQPASSQTRAAQSREQQTRTLANLVYSMASKFIWALALLLVLQEFGISVIPVVLAVGLIAVALALGVRNFLRDIISGFYIVWEDQYLVGDTIQVGETVGRVEHLTLRRTLLRDSRGALVTLSNGDIRTVSNLSRDWSQTFVDVAVSPQVPQERAIQALDAAAAELRNDPSWSQALLDGPRILGLQSYDQDVSTIRMQVRTAPSRQDDVARELRRRIQLEFQRQGIALSNVQRIELVNAPGVPSPGAPVSSA